MLSKDPKVIAEFIKNILIIKRFLTEKAKQHDGTGNAAAKTEYTTVEYREIRKTGRKSEAKGEPDAKSKTKLLKFYAFI